MFQVVIGVIAISLAAMLVIAGMNYLNVDRMTEIGLATRIEAESAALRSAIAAYRVANGSLPEGEEWPSGLAPYLSAPSILALHSAGEGSGEGDEGEGDEGGEDHGSGPPLPGKDWAFHWSAGRTDGKPYICLSRETAGSIEIGAARRVAFPAAALGSKAVMATGCGALPDDGKELPRSGDDLALTFYLYDMPVVPDVGGD